MITIAIPARNEIYLKQTVNDLFKRAAGEIEVILVLDDCWNLPLPDDNPRLTIIHRSRRMGMRAGINAAAEIGKGKYLLKLDAHVLMCEGFDEILAKNCDDDWLVTPSRYSLDVEAWERKTDKPVVDYEYLSYPYQDGEMVGLHAKYWWNERSRARRHVSPVDENMAFQGSAWFMPMRYFRELIYPMDIPNYGLFVGEPQEIGLKVWLSGGKCMINKDAWYAHLWKGKPYRELFLKTYGVPYTRVGASDFKKGNLYSTEFWFGNKWPERKHDLGWLVERFWPVPTWPEDRTLWTR